MTISKEAVLGDAYGAVAEVRSLLPNVVGAVVTHASRELMRVDLRLAPPLELAPHGYPVEWVCVAVSTGEPEPSAYPLRRGLTWEHRHPDPLLGDRQGPLCLWYPRDPSRLRWSWSDGFESYVAIVHRHLIGEEYFRQHGAWPWRDVPHRERPDGRPHPVLSRKRAA